MRLTFGQSAGHPLAKIFRVDDTSFPTHSRSLIIKTGQADSTGICISSSICIWIRISQSRQIACLIWKASSGAAVCSDRVEPDMSWIRASDTSS